MTLPDTPVTIHGGCNCRAIRYKISLPPVSERPLNPYHDPGTDIGGIRLPMVAIDHCNDCRRATGALIPFWIATHLPTVTASVRSRSGQSGDGEEEETWHPAAEVFDRDSSVSKDSFLAFYESSKDRIRSFCGQCGTNLAYRMDKASVPDLQGRPEMLDVLLGTVDREDLEKEWFVPERALWSNFGIDWVRKLVREGAGGTPEHPLWKINEVVGHDGRV